jgi:hypothetical protein
VLKNAFLPGIAGRYTVFTMTEEQSWSWKRMVVGGAIVGAVLTLVFSLLMDVLYSDVLQGTWRDAIVHDMERFFSISLAPSSPLVYVLLVVILLLLSGVGALVGIVFAFILFKFLSFLGS